MGSEYLQQKDLLWKNFRENITSGREVELGEMH